MRLTAAIASIRYPLATLAVALCVFMVPISSASAHDSLAGSNPRDGQTVQRMPEAINLTFTSPPIALGSEVTVKDAEGKNWATGKVEIADNVANQQVSAEAPSGEYTVSWRVVSEDSHPIEGTFGFTSTTGFQEAEEASPAAAEPTSVADESTAPEEAAPEPAASVTEKATQAFSPIIVVAMFITLAVLAAVIFVVARRRMVNRDD